jgi:hypothetical protein
MDPKELRGLMEAYAKVNAPQEELDEASPIYSRGGEQRRTQTPRQIGVKSAPHNIPRGGTTISDRDPQGKRLFTGDQDRGKGSKAARRAAELKNEELDIFDVVLEFLQAEGYAETLEEAEWLMANVIDEEAIAIIVEAMHGEEEDDEDEKEMKKGKKSKKSEEDDDDDEDEDELDEASYSAKAARAGKDIGNPGKAFAKIAKSAAKRYGSKERGEKVAGAVLAKLRKEGFEKWLDEAMTNYEKNRKRAAQRAAARNAARDQGKTGAVPGVGYVTPRREKETWTDESGKTRHAKGL